MNPLTTGLTVFFEDPFWVGLFERECDGKYEACKVTFGAEPKDYQVYQFFLDHWRGLRFTLSVTVERAQFYQKNPKRMQREAQKAVQTTGIGTKAQQALKLQYEACKKEHQERSKAQREADAKRHFQLKQEKRKEKHKGR